MTVISYITEATVVSKILTHLGLPTSAPVVAPARRLDDNQPELDLGDYAEGDPITPPHQHLARAPPQLDWEVDADLPTDRDGCSGA